MCVVHWTRDTEAKVCLAGCVQDKVGLVVNSGRIVSFISMHEVSVDVSTTVLYGGEFRDKACKGEFRQGSQAVLRIGTLRDARVEWAVAFPVHHVHHSASAPVPALGKKQTATQALFVDYRL